MEVAGAIAGYRLDLDPATLGLPISAYIRVRPAPGQLSQIAELVKQLPQVVESHRITGENFFSHARSIRRHPQFGRHPRPVSSAWSDNDIDCAIDARTAPASSASVNNSVTTGWYRHHEPALAFL
jgi:hypothetical protein